MVNYKKKYTLAGQINIKSLKFVQSKKKKKSKKLQQKQVKTLQGKLQVDLNSLARKKGHTRKKTLHKMISTFIRTNKQWNYKTFFQQTYSLYK